MRISVITSSYPRYKGDGIAHFVLSISEHLASQSHELDVIAPYDSEVVVDEAANPPIKRVRYTWKDSWHIMGHGRSLFADVKLRPGVFILLPSYLLMCMLNLLKSTIKLRANVIHAHWVLPGGLIAALVSKVTRTPFVVSLHGSDIFVANSNPVFRQVARWIFRRASAVTACSPVLKDAALALGSNLETTHLVPYGVDEVAFVPEHDREAACQRLGVDSDAVYVVSLGRMVYKKGFTHLIEAWRDVAEQFPDAKLIIGGEGPLKQVLMDQASENDLDHNIILPGNMNRQGVIDLFAVASIFVLPSIRDAAGNVDGLPNVLMEAMSSGQAIIASDISGVPVVIQDGFNGLLVEPEKPDELAQAIKLLLLDEAMRIRLGSTARECVLEKHTWVHVAEEFSTILENAVSAESQ